MTEEKITPQGEQVTENIWLCPDGVYRWTYEYEMLKNPTIMFTVWKVLGISIGVVFLFTFIVDLLDGGIESTDGLLWPVKLLLIMAGIMLVLSIISYIILAAMYGWKYQVLFEMTDEYVRHIQMPKQVKKAEAIGWLTVLVGLAAKNPTTVGVGLNAAARSTMTTELEKTAVLKFRRKRETIHVNLKLDKNQVYAKDADFDFVEKFLREHCPNAKIK